MVATLHSPASSKPKLNDIIRDLLRDRQTVPGLYGHQSTVLHRLSNCGTEKAGLLKLQCQDCGDIEWRALGCQDRHCPSCGAKRAEEWIQARLDDVLDVPYFHLTFPLPREFRTLCRENPQEFFALLFFVVQQILKDFATKAEHLGGTPAFFCILHTANRPLDYYPHIHVVMAGATFDEATGKLAVVPDSKRLFPVNELADAFRDRLLEELRACAQAGKLTFSWRKNRHLADPDAFEDLLTELADKRWTVWCKPVTTDVETTIRYLGRYVQRTAITNARIERYDGSTVTYTWTDGKTGHKHAKTVDQLTFVRRYGQHILPKGFQRIRSYGLLSPSKRKAVLPRAQAAAKKQAKRRTLVDAVKAALSPERMPPPDCCKACGAQALRAVAVIRGNTITILHPPTYATPPPPEHGPTRREAP